jgi:hypothetical protein
MTSAVGGNPLPESLSGPCRRLRYHELNTHKVTNTNTWKHFGQARTQVLNSVILVLLRQETATWGGLDLGSVGPGVWEGDYGWGVRVRRPFGARGRSSVRYGTRFGDLTENWFLLFSN